MKTAVIGGGAAGLFLAVCLGEMFNKDKNNKQQMQITVFEKSNKVLSKLEISGGGRCNCTNTFEFAKDLSLVYPRGFRLMKKLFNVFSPQDAFSWFESHGVKLKTEDNGRVFPVTDNSHTIINMFLHYARKYNINIKTNSPVTSLNEVKDFDFIALTFGGLLHAGHNGIFKELNINIVEPVASLFAMKTEDKELNKLAGITLSDVMIMIPKTKIKSCGNLLITHQGITGPCVLQMSSYAARLLKECNYKTNLLVNWVNMKDSQVLQALEECIISNPERIIANCNNFSLPQRFWEYILCKVMPNRTDIRYKDLTKKETNRIVNVLCNDIITLNGRNTHKEEFVTCGGVALECINHSNMSLKEHNRIFLAGEVTDTDGITGGYNFQAAWTTAFIAAQGIYNTCQSGSVQ